MKFTWHAMFQAIATAIQGANQFVPKVQSFLSPKGQTVLVIGLSALQAGVGLLAHFRTPQGNKLGKSE